tara:strand:- start:215 stop:397 length:183 start_codon:yes stop_codon:yes gene_type:complete
MNISSAQYVVSTIPDEPTGNVAIKATIDGQELFVPLDPDNRHYQAIQEWVAEGNTIQDAE